MGDRLKQIIIILTKPKEQMMAYDVFVFFINSLLLRKHLKTQ